MAEYTVDYLEFWATKHCNLNCKGCSSCSPIADKWELDERKLNDDLQRLSDLEINIKNINVLGGEPLLHPNITGIFDTVKNIYPECRLGLLTNGLLLLKMNGTFWQSCVNHGVTLNVTCFPVMNIDTRNRIVERINEYGLKYHMTNKTKFNKILVLNNKASMDKVLKSCGCNDAYNLYGGYISRCTVPISALILNRYFSTNFIEEGLINIYEVNTGEQIIKFLNSPNASCMNCSENPRKVDWDRVRGVPQLSDWVIT